MELERKSIVVLGSTGSVGRQTLEVAEALGYPVLALTANRRVDLLEEQCRKFRPRYVACADPDAAATLRVKLADTPVEVLSGEEGVLTCARLEGADLVLNAIVGVAGLLPTVAALSVPGRPLALANKETMVCGGDYVTRLARRNGCPILPVDSEHSAIFQSLQQSYLGGREKEEVKRLILTASGGPFFGRTRAELEFVTPAQALKHPNWDMGGKITIDSATMMNKGLEVMEAMWLFDMPLEKISVVVHRESIIHSLVEYNDKAMIAQLGAPDMRLPIQYAMTYPRRVAGPVKELDLLSCGSLTFAPPDEVNFPCLALAKEAARRGGTAPAILNGANETAVDLFLREKIGFLDIPRRVERALERVEAVDSWEPEAVLAADILAREAVRS